MSANGVEDERQRTPANMLDIARLLLDAGAAVDATSEAYGGGSTTLGLASTSAHPRAAGVQIALIDLLLEKGARIDGEHDLRALVTGAIANGCPEAARALAGRGARVSTLYAAAGVGNLRQAQALFDTSSTSMRESALIVAAMQGHTTIVEFLLDHGVDIAACDGMTALHAASAGGHLETMAVLIDRGAPLEALNAYGGSVLDGTLWFAFHARDEDFAVRDYPRVIVALIAAGARTDRYPGMRAHIAEIHARARRHDAPATA
ncbi:MAG: ankyrin repeat domain-containing protein [Gemmatimonadaceae bacterium]|nr:ankyrin repeat domain-containing protein [Gemmatimonadaceae bacterium]